MEFLKKTNREYFPKANLNFKSGSKKVWRTSEPHFCDNCNVSNRVMILGKKHGF